VTPTDPDGGIPFALGYPPYSIDDCRLAYIAPPPTGQTAGPLLLRDLATGAEELIAPASEKPRRPSLAGGVLAWEAEDAGKRVVRVHTASGTVTLTGAFHHAGEPRAASDAVVFTAFLTDKDSGDADIHLATPGDAQSTPLLSGPGQQRFADISPTHVACADFSEDPDGTFDENATDLADILLLDRASGTKATRHRTGKQAFPMLGAAGKVAYLSWGPEHPEPKFSAYDLVIGALAAPAAEDAVAASITTSSPYVRPTAHGTDLEWVSWPPGDSASLLRRPADLSTSATTVPGFAGAGLYGPAASSRLTVAAAPDGAGAMILRAEEH
jgi:hypothetical protein